MAKVTQGVGSNIYLIGFMGVGKTAVGRLLARMLRMGFIDSDAVIEQQQGMTIAEIFAQHGEAHFRELERKFVESGHLETGMVVSCGGGLPLQPGMRELLLSKGVVICLFARTETILRRTLGNAKRPLLNVANPEARVRSLLAEREPVYMRTGIGVSTDGRSIHEVVKNIIRIYRRHSRGAAELKGDPKTNEDSTSSN